MHAELKKFPTLKLNTKKCKEISTEDSKQPQAERKLVDQTFLTIPRMKFCEKDNFNKNQKKEKLLEKLCFSLR